MTTTAICPTESLHTDLSTRRALPHAPLQLFWAYMKPWLTLMADNLCGLDHFTRSPCTSRNSRHKTPLQLITSLNGHSQIENVVSIKDGRYRPLASSEIFAQCPFLRSCNDCYTQVVQSLCQLMHSEDVDGTTLKRLLPTKIAGTKQTVIDRVWSAFGPSTFSVNKEGSEFRGGGNVEHS